MGEHLSAGCVRVARLDCADDGPVMLVDRPVEPAAERRACEVRLEHGEDGLGRDRDQRVPARFDDDGVELLVVDELLLRPEPERLTGNRRTQQLEVATGPPLGCEAAGTSSSSRASRNSSSETSCASVSRLMLACRNSEMWSTLGSVT